MWGPIPTGTVQKMFCIGTGGASPSPTGFNFLPVENPAVFAVLFEAAKAKFAVCNNRACLAKNAVAFFACNARPQGGHGGPPPCAFSFVYFFDARQRNGHIKQRLESYVRTF